MRTNDAWYMFLSASFTQVEEEETTVVYLAWKVFSKEVLKELYSLSLEDQSRSGWGVLKYCTYIMEAFSTLHTHMNNVIFLFCSNIAEVLGLTQFQEDVRTAAQLDFYMAAYSYPLAHKSCVCTM